MAELEKYRDKFRNYTELRLQENMSQIIVVLNGDCISNDEKREGGGSARVFKDGLWGFASSPSKDSENIQKILRKAEENADFMSSRFKNTDRIFRKFEHKNFEIDLTTKKQKMTRKQKMDFIRGVDSYILNKYPKLKSRQILYYHLLMRKELMTSEGAHVIQSIPRSFLRVSLTTDSQPINLSDSFGGLGDLEDIYESPEELFGGTDELYGKLMKKRDGTFPKAGFKEVILGADLAGILAHEAMGHTTEADFVFGGSVAADLLDKKVASENVNLVDFANKAFGKTCPVPVYFDDEGIEAKDAVVIEGGILKSYLHNRRSAEFFNTDPTGNARAYNFDDEPLIRMRNTCILPGKDKIEDMVSSIEDGYYLENPANGQADSTSEFMFGVTFGYEIKKGKLTKALKDTTISGTAIDLLKTVTMISDDLRWESSGMCGKKQPMPVGMGGPAIKCKVNIGGN